MPPQVATELMKLFNSLSESCRYQPAFFPEVSLVLYRHAKDIDVWWELTATLDMVGKYVCNYSITGPIRPALLDVESGSGSHVVLHLGGVFATNPRATATRDKIKLKLYTDESGKIYQSETVVE